MREQRRADKALRRRAPSRRGVYEGDAGGQQRDAQAKKGSGGGGPRGQGLTQDQRWLDTGVDGREREGTRSILHKKRKLDGACDGGKEEGTSVSDRITKAEATRAV